MSKYELVAGLETHIELATNTKIFCGCTTEFGGEANTHCCPVCIGLPGTLPKLNKRVVEYAIRAGLATNCKIAEISKMDRKNYCYPDLPKAYQISQFDKPLCYEGYVQLSNGRKIRLTRIHIEEDAGKLIHKNGDTYVDYNRGGVPLIEIVSEPDIRSVEEAREYVEKLQQIIRYVGVSDCKMQEGSMRCDVNISVRPQGSDTLGTRTEIKNMNSITFIAKAMEYEFERQVDLIESGGSVVQETLRYDDATNTTSSMRSKEDAHDYRYFREPDLVTISVSKEQVDAIAKTLPELPEAKLQRYVQELGIPQKDAELLTKYRRITEFFESASIGLQNPKTVANFILGSVFKTLETESAKEDFKILTTPAQLNELVKLIESGKIKNNLAKAALDKMLASGKGATDFIDESDMGGLDEAALTELCKQAISSNPAAVEDYKNGKEKALQSLLGYIMKNSRGKADAQAALAMLKDLAV
ncbi:MAG: Asp-tRNA(Asn)/Glu-tRNA(Gln) amidotransferase subunit GatB [Oscillospiraceae bacterium]|jgi:aspartyl-tRNA(Asn)/glutamyl-tRNA(Gln) amidotransferase subunit B|nr:Asp-tRNA(Asn)/Glu-tRNA(Gln) amidotransferase subunit GatB [Oscillospiraceae bacterium]